MTDIEINGKQIKAETGQMIIEVADACEIPIPRFCYHKKLSIVANCRMCLVEVENSPKTLPACATPIADGMKIHTTSPKAIAAQKAVMEFLLINHPLDCPICDQGGECELQDVAMGYGEGVSRFNEGKRVVLDEDLGPLIATDMTRCIHCTRCVRFGEEVAGIRELGATGRGEHMRIGTYIKHSMRSEVSGNIIDLCPVGALTSKPFRFRARAWELRQAATIAAHDCLGSNIYVHTLANKVMRVVPKENESINETWISDRDRFSYLGLHSEQRLAKPMIKKDGRWQESEWQDALEYTVKQLQQVLSKQGAEQLGVLTSPNATTEACYLLQKLSRAIGCPNIDHRVQQTDFADQGNAPLFYGSQIPYADLEKQQAILLIGSNLAQEQPLAAVRVRKAALQGAKVMAINPIDYCFNFDSAEKVICSPTALPSELAQVVKALSGENLPSGADKLLADIQASEIGKAIAQQLQAVEKAVIVLGALAMNHPQAALIRSLVQLLAKSSGAEIIYMTQGANSAGATLAGTVPHRLVGGKVSSQVGLDAHAMLQKKLKAYLLLDLEPELDCADPHRALLAMQQAEFVVCLSAFQTPTMADYADVILPIAAFSEDAGTYVNVEGQWQSFTAAVKPYEQARPAWKILRVLANLLDLAGFDYNHSAEIKADVEAQLAETTFKPQDWHDPQAMTKQPEQGLTRIGEWMMYGSDGLVRRAQALQDSAANVPIAARFSPQTAEQYNLSAGKPVKLGQHEQTIELPVIIDERLAVGCVCLPCGLTATMNLGVSFAQVEVK